VANSAGLSRNSTTDHLDDSVISLERAGDAKRQLDILMMNGPTAEILSERFTVHSDSARAWNESHASDCGFPATRTVVISTFFHDYPLLSIARRQPKIDHLLAGR